MSLVSPVQVVLVDSDPAGIAHLEDLLGGVCEFHLSPARRLSDALDHVAGGAQAVLVESAHTERPAPHIIQRLFEAAPHVPILVLSRSPDHTVNADCLEAGAQVCLTGEHLRGPLLAEAIRSAIKRKQAERRVLVSAADLETMRVSAAGLETMRVSAAGLGAAPPDAEMAAAALRVAYEHAPIGMALVDMQGRRVIQANPALCRITGYAEADLIAMKLQELSHPDDLELVRAEAGRLLRGEVSISEMDSRCIHRDGRTVWLRTTASIVRRGGGEPFLVVAQCRDVTRRKRAEAARAFLVDAAQILGASLDLDETVGTLVRLAVPRLADCAVVELRDERGLSAWDVAATTAQKEELLAGLKRRYPERGTGAGSPLGQVLATGRSLLWRSIPRAELLSVAEDDVHRELLERLAPTSVIMAPLTARGRVHGVFVLAASESGHHYTRDDLKAAEDLARIAALAIDNARLIRRPGNALAGPAAASSLPGASAPADTGDGWPERPADAAAATGADDRRTRRRLPDEDLLAELTGQERRVLALAARGFPSAEIGRQLFLSPRTVETYRSRAMRKLGLTNRAGLVELALRAGLLDS
jgi:PAS domain S-box-containing protein